jgi:predicted RNase H-like HicB family nuclease
MNHTPAAFHYPVVIHKDEDSDYGVTVPDLPGCFSAGRTLDEAIEMAREAIELHLEGLLDEAQLPPRPSPIEALRRKPDYKGATWAVVSVAPSRLRVKAKRINTTMPRRILDAVDRFARATHDTRSGLLARAAAAYVHGHPATPARPQARAVSRSKRP